MPDIGRTILYVFDSAVEEFRPATDDEIDTATNLSTYAQSAVRYHAALAAIRPVVGGVASKQLAPGALDEVAWRIDHALNA